MQLRQSRRIVAYLLITGLSLLVSCGGGGGDTIPINGIPNPGGGPFDDLDPNLVIPPAESFVDASQPGDTNAEKWLSNYYFTLPPLDSPDGVFQNTSLKSWSDQIFAGINGKRAAVAAAPLVNDPHLTAVAQAHARNMALNNFFDHVNNYGMNWQDRLAAVNPPENLSLGENAAKGQETVGELMAGWSASPGHNQNMLQASFTHVGIGVYLDPTDKQMPMHVIALFGWFTEDPAEHPDWINPGPQMPPHDEGTGGSV